MYHPLVKPLPVKPLHFFNSEYIYIPENSDLNNREPCIPDYQKKCLKKGFCIVGSIIMYGGSIITIGLLIYWQSIYPHTHN